MKLSPRMVEMLKFIELVDRPPKTRCGPGLPTHHANKVVHHALVKRGLIAMDKQGYTHLTPTGKQAIRGGRAPRGSNPIPDEDRYCWAVVEHMPPIAGLSPYIVECLSDRPLSVPKGTRIMAKRLSHGAAWRLAKHLNSQWGRGRKKIDVIDVTKRRNPRFLRGGRRGAFFSVRRSNPTLAIMGANPPAAGEEIKATWAFLSYRRPDDPDGKRIVREHEFPDGFIAVPLEDGSILLKHPRGQNLWTRR